MQFVANKGIFKFLAIKKVKNTSIQNTKRGFIFYSTIKLLLFRVQFLVNGLYFHNYLTSFQNSMKNHIFIVMVALSFFSCTNQNKSNLQVLPTFIHEGDSVTVNLIADSIGIDTTDLFFHIDVWKQDLSYIKAYIKIENGQGKFKVPKGAAYFEGFFYNLNERPDNKTYKRSIYDKDNKPVLNAYQEEGTKKAIAKELLNHPTNFAAYGKYISQLGNKFYTGQVSDSLISKKAKEFLSIVEPKADLTKADDLYALTLLYSHTGQMELAKQCVLKLAQNHPNSNCLKRAKLSFWFADEIFPKKEVGDGELQVNTIDSFLDSINNYISQNYPHSPEGRWRSFIGVGADKGSLFSNQETIDNLYYDFKYQDSSNINTIGNLLDIKLKIKEYDSAEILGQKFLHLVNRDMLKHYFISDYKERGKEINDKPNYLAISYFNLSKVAEAQEHWQKAINYLDSASTNIRKIDKNMMFFNFDKRLKGNQCKKANLQRKNKQAADALETYEALYREIQDTTILDSIKVLFEEQDQVQDFENYAQNLKNQTGDDKEEIKLIPEFNFKDTKGSVYNRENLKGSVVVLNFWGNYCSPCAREIPLINDFWEAVQGHEVVFLGLTRDDKTAIGRFERRQKGTGKEMFKFPVVATNQELFDAFNVLLIPTQIIINAKGEIVFRQIGATSDAKQNLKTALEKELGGEISLLE
jgi:thiol-disulfide isomerase/thioredoxin